MTLLDGTLMKLKKVNTSIEQIVDVYKRLAVYYRQSQELMHQQNQINDSIKKAEDDLAAHRQAVMDILHLKEFNLEKVRDFIYPQLWEELYIQKNLVEQLEKQIRALQKN